MLLSFFALEVCLPYDSALHDELRRRIAVRRERMTPGDKWLFYRDFFQLLHGAVPAIQRGCWDYFDDDAKAKTLFEDWSKTIRGGPGPRTRPSNEADPYRSPTTYMTATVAFQIVKDSACDVELRQLCSFPQAALWERATFAHILAGLGVVNFDRVQADIVYLVPRDADWALTLEDLASPTFDYLRQVT